MDWPEREGEKWQVCYKHGNGVGVQATLANGQARTELCGQGLFFGGATVSLQALGRLIMRRKCFLRLPHIHCSLSVGDSLAQVCPLLVGG